MQNQRSRNSLAPVHSENRKSVGLTEWQASNGRTLKKPLLPTASNSIPQNLAANVAHQQNTSSMVSQTPQLTNTSAKTIPSSTATVGGKYKAVPGKVLQSLNISAVTPAAPKSSSLPLASRVPQGRLSQARPLSAQRPAARKSVSTISGTLPLPKSTVALGARLSKISAREYLSQHGHTPAGLRHLSCIVDVTPQQLLDELLRHVSKINSVSDGTLDACLRFCKQQLDTGACSIVADALRQLQRKHPQVLSSWLYWVVLAEAVAKGSGRNAALLVYRQALEHLAGKAEALRLLCDSCLDLIELGIFDLPLPSHQNERPFSTSSLEEVAFIDGRTDTGVPCTSGYVPPLSAERLVNTTFTTESPGSAFTPVAPEDHSGSEVSFDAVTGEYDAGAPNEGSNAALNVTTVLAPAAVSQATFTAASTTFTAATGAEGEHALEEQAYNDVSFDDDALEVIAAPRLKSIAEEEDVVACSAQAMLSPIRAFHLDTALLTASTPISPRVVTKTVFPEAIPRVPEVIVSVSDEMLDDIDPLDTLEDLNISDDVMSPTSDFHTPNETYRAKRTSVKKSATGTKCASRGKQIDENARPASVVKYAVTTPLQNRALSKNRGVLKSNGAVNIVQSIKVVTPVRRNVRERSLPPMLQEHDTLVNSAQDLNDLGVQVWVNAKNGNLPSWVDSPECATDFGL